MGDYQSITDKSMDKKRLKIAYAAPQTEVCAADPYRFLAASNTDLGGGHEDGEAPGEGDIVGAKGFGFDDESYEQEYGWGDLWKE